MEEQAPLGSARPSPKVFVRSIAVPAGLPWEQARAAAMDARHGAPIPLKDVTYRLRRIGSWRPGPGRFAGFYVRTDEFQASFSSTLDVDGQPVTIRFVHPEEGRERSKLAGGVVLASVGVAIVLASAVSASLAQRSRISLRLETAEQRVERQSRAAQTMQRRYEQSRLLEAAARNDRPVTQLVSDIGWVAANKTSSARLEAVHWDHGVIAIETRGSESPLGLTERVFVRSDKPVRSGVWLWGAAMPSSARASRGQGAGPTASELR